MQRNNKDTDDDPTKNMSSLQKARYLSMKSQQERVLNRVKQLKLSPSSKTVNIPEPRGKFPTINTLRTSNKRRVEDTITSSVKISKEKIDGNILQQSVLKKARTDSSATIHITKFGGDDSSLCHSFSSSSYEVRTKFRVAVGQMTSINNKLKNFETCRNLANEAKSLGAEMLCLPENFHYLGINLQDTYDNAESLDGQSIKLYQELAKTNGLYLSLGGFHEKGNLVEVDDTAVSKSSTNLKKMYNSHLIISPQGKILAVYRKIHLFDAKSGEICYKESRLTAAGNEIVSLPLELQHERNDPSIVASTRNNKASSHPSRTSRSSKKTMIYNNGVFHLGLSICYDVRFPELYAALRDRGSNVLLVPSAFTLRTGLAHWEVLLRSRAIETQSYVIAAAQTGIHSSESKRESYGYACVIDPWGTVIANCGREGAGVAIATLDLESIQHVRDMIPIISHKRHDLFHSINRIAHT